MNDFSHIQMFNYSICQGNVLVEQVGLFNCNKLPTGIAFECARNGINNPYLLTMSKAKFNALFLDETIDKPTEIVREVNDETKEDNN